MHISSSHTPTYPPTHQVLPTFGDRHAITLWYYDQAERLEAVRKAREEGSARKVSTATEQEQQLAKVSG